MNEAARDLTMRSSRIGRFLVLLLISLFWNGITGVFVGIAVSSWIEGEPEIFLTIFILPFVLIGLGLFAAAIHAFMGMFNPKAALSVRPGVAHPGETIELTWRLDGRTGVLQELAVVLEGREEATYRRGTNTTTDNAVFHTRPLLETANPMEMGGGILEVALPPDTMHTFEGKHNKIYWVLAVRGDIRRWPDIDDEYEIEVRPAGV